MKKPTEPKILSVLRAWYIVGILGFALPFSRPVFQMLIPLSLLLLAAVFLLYHEARTTRLWVVLAFIFLAGFGVEVAGVRTGVIFGVYHYGPSLGPKLFEVPVIMGLNWVIMIYGGAAISAALIRHPLPGSLVSAGLITASDYFIEHFALLSEMWFWEGDGPPLRNFLAWFGLSFLFTLLLYGEVSGKRRTVAIHGYIYQFLLFVITVGIHLIFWP